MSGGNPMTTQHSSERLAFNDSAAAPAQHVRAQLAQAESGQWGYRGLLAFTAVLLLRPQDQIGGLAWLHPAQICGVFGNPNDLALNMVTFMPLAIVIAMTPCFNSGRRLLAAGIAALMLATVFFTKSRGGAIGLFVMFTVLLFLGRRTRLAIIGAT